jgi:hypothetical protein
MRPKLAQCSHLTLPLLAAVSFLCGPVAPLSATRPQHRLSFPFSPGGLDTAGTVIFWQWSEVRQPFAILTFCSRRQ